MAALELKRLCAVILSDEHNNTYYLYFSLCPPMPFTTLHPLLITVRIVIMTVMYTYLKVEECFYKYIWYYFRGMS